MSSVVFDILAVDKASAVLGRVAKSVDNTQNALNRISDGAMRVGGALTAGVTTPLVALGAKSFDVFAKFDQTMRQVGVQTKQTGAGLKELTDLAKDLGAQTSFSAGEAADAMLELAKGGLTAAQIKAGALEQTLTLAAAGSVGLGEAATFMSNALNAFGLKATDAARVAAALAGGANASTASVQSLGQALSQVGPGARNAGLSLNDTVAVLAAFDQAGIKGSDAGTSLKTMLARLVPQTDAAAEAMRDLGINFTNADGSFKGITEIAQILQDKLKGLSAAERTTALQTIFGSDATRAATVLMNEGSKGVEKYRKATMDLAAAQKLAKVNTSGAAGTIEQMQGAIETAQIALGEMLAPTITKVANKVAEFANAFTDLDPRLQQMIVKIAAIAAATGPALIAFGTLVRVISMVRTAFMALSSVFLASPIGLIIAGIAALIAIMVVAYQRSEKFRAICQAAFTLVKNTVTSVLLPALKQLAAVWRSDISPAVQDFITEAKPVVKWLISYMVPVFAQAFKGIIEIVAGAIKIIAGILRVFTAVMSGDWKKAWSGMKMILSGALSVIKGAIRSAFLSYLPQSVKNGAMSAWRSLKSGVGRWISFLRGLAGMVRNAVGNLDNVLVDAGRGIIRGLIRGVEQMLGSLKAKLSQVTQFIRDHKGPERVDLKLLVPAGRNIMAGLMAGISDGLHPLGNLLGDVTASIPGAVTSSPTPAVASTGGGTVVNVHFHAPVGSPQELENWLVKAISNASRKGRLNAAVVRG